MAPGSFQSELGCASDWDAGCLRSWLQDIDGDGIYTFETTALPAGPYEAKVAINESFNENYGANGVPNGSNIAFNVPSDGTKVTFTYDATTHILTIEVATNHGAPGGPGALSHFDLARKDCLGTARNTESKVWYTVAGGLLSDVYYPTVDNTNVETLQYLVTDGATFTDLQSRDMTYTVQAVTDTGGMACRVTASDKDGLYSIETTYVTDPSRNAVLMRLAFTPKPKPNSNGLQLFVRFDPTVNGNGGGGTGNGGADTATVDDTSGHPVLVASDPVTATNAANRDYAQPVFAALDGPFDDASVGFAGSESDGLEQLDDSHALTPIHPDAREGNVVATARLALDGSGKTLLSLGFGATDDEAIDTAAGSLTAGFDAAFNAYKSGWNAYDATLTNPHVEKLAVSVAQRKQLKDAYYLSANVIKASEDKTFPGAIVASLASPWGQAVSAGDPNNTYFGSYREVFARDLYESWTGLVAAGDLATARDATLFLFERQQLPDGSFPRNSLVNGKVAPDSFGTQLDEVAYPILMAYQLGLTDASLVRGPHQARRELRRRPRAGLRRGALGGAERILAIDDRFRDRRPRRGCRAGDGERRPRLRGGLAGRCRRDAALGQGMDRDDQRAVVGRAVLHPAVEDRRSERGDHVQRRQRRPGPRPARGDRRRLPRARPARRVAGRRSRRPANAADRRRGDHVDDAERPRLAPLQRRRLRRSSQRRPALGTKRTGDRPPLAGTVR